jgi:glycosyltransferase involved in cell wall biosynthesis
MVQDGYPADPKTRQSFRVIEERALRRASFSVFVTPGAARTYRDRYPEVPADRFAVIENGYDEESFVRPERADEGPLVPGAFTLVHSGIVYPSERDPTQLFRALRVLLDDGRLKAGELRLRLRAPAHEDLLAKLIDEFRLAGVVELCPHIPYRQALREMLLADGLLVLQAANCNDQIPAKVYEYLRCRRPIIALTDPAGDTAGLLRRAGVHSIARLDSTEAIALELPRFMAQARRGEAALPDEAFVARTSRLHRARELTGLLERLDKSGQASAV